MPISDCWPDLEQSLALLDPPTHKRITSLHNLLLPLSTQIQDYATSLHPSHLSCRLITSAFTWGQSFLVYEIVFDDEERSWVARFGLPPYEGDEFFNTPEQLERKILNEVGALKVVKERTTVPVPDIFGFCARHGDAFQRHFGMVVDEQPPISTHPLGEAFPAFIIMSAMRGKTIEECGFPVHELGGHWESPTSDTYGHLQSPILRRYLSSLAAIHVQLSQITFSQIGSFTMDGDTVRIGPMAEFGLGPFDTAEEYYAVMAEAFKRIAESAEEEEDEGNSEVVINIQDEDVSLPSSEVKTLRRMFTASLFPLALTPHISQENNHGPFPVRHGDLHSENILVDEDTGEVVGVIDWEGAGTVPWEVTGALNWEVQGEVIEDGRPEVHGAFNESLKKIEGEMQVRFEARTRRPKKLHFEERRSSVASVYVTPPTSAYSSSASLTSSSSSFVSFGGTELFSDVEDDPCRQATHSRSSSSSRSNLTGMTSPPTSPASSLFFDVAKKESSVLNKISEAQAKIMSVFTRMASEPAASPATKQPPTSPIYATIESIREPLPTTPKCSGTESTSDGISSLSLSVAALSITGGLSNTTAVPPSSYPSGAISHSPLSISPQPSPSTPSTPLTSPSYHLPGLTPRPGLRYMGSHRRRQSSMALSIIPNLVSPSSGMGSGGPGSSLPLPPGMGRSRTPSPSPSAPNSPLVSSAMLASHVRPGAYHHSRRPSSFYLPGSLSRSSSGSGSGMMPMSAGLSAGRNWTTAPSSPVLSTRNLSGSGGSYSSSGGGLISRAASVGSSRSSGSTAATISAATAVAAAAPTSVTAEPESLSHSRSSSTTERAANVSGAGRTAAPPPLHSPTTPGLPAKSRPLESIFKGSVTASMSMDTQPPVTAPSGVLLSDLHASVGSYVAGYLGHWMYVYACEWETVGKALWEVVERGTAGSGKGGGEGEVVVREDGDGEDRAERAFWSWVKDVWMVEQGEVV